MVKDLERMQLLDWVRNEDGNFCQIVTMDITDGLVLGLKQTGTDTVKYYSTLNQKAIKKGAKPLSCIKFAKIGKKIIGRFDWPVVEEDQDEFCYEVPGLENAFIWTDGSYNVYNKFQNHMDEGSCRYLHEFQHVLSEHDMSFDFVPSRNPMFVDKED